MRGIGLILVLAGVVWALIAFNMQTTVTTDSQTIGSGEYAMHMPSVTVQNIGLLDARRNQLMFAGITILAGIVLVGFGSAPGQSTGAALQPCPTCAELIQPNALKCRFCNADLPASFRPILPPPKPPVSAIKSFFIMVAILVAIVAGLFLLAKML